MGTIAKNSASTAIGKFNDYNDVKALFTVGNGDDTNSRSNSFVVRDNGEIVVAPTSASGGKIVFGSGDETTHDEHCYIEESSNENLNIYGGRGVTVKGDSGVIIETEDSGSTINLNSQEGTYIERNTYCDGSYYAFSDDNEINVVDKVPLDKAYELVNKCVNIFYTLKNGNGNNNQREIGLLATEVKKYFPELVKAGTDGYLYIDYSKITVILLTLIRDLIIKIDAIDERLSVIEEKL